MRQIATHVTGAVALIVLLLSLLIPVVSSRSAAQSQLLHTEAVVEAEEPPGSRLESGVRALPLVLSGGYVAEHFPDGRGLEDTVKVRSGLVEVATHLGLADVIEDMLATAPKPGATYPYTYDPYDALVREAIRPTSPNNHELVIDFSTLAVALAVHSNDPEYDTGAEWGAAAAYSVLNAARQDSNSCDLQTNLAFVVTLGQDTSYDHVAEETVNAERLCGAADPTPRWIEAEFLSTQAKVTGELRQLSRSAAKRRQMAESAFADLRDRFPDLPVGYAGGADLYLAWADAAEGEVGGPFQVRRWREDAASLYAEARRRLTDPRLSVGHARALSALGQHAAARSLVESAAAKLPGDYTTAIVHAEILSRAGAHADAAEIIAEPGQLEWWISSRATLREDFPTGAYGTEDFPPLVLLDQAQGAHGGGGAHDLSFIPTSRHPRNSPFCRTGWEMEERLLAGQPDRVQQMIKGGRRANQIIPDRLCYEPYPEDPSTLRIAAFTALSLDDDVWLAELVDDIADLAYDGDHAGTESDLRDRWQDLLRSAGRFDEARTAAADWTSAQPADGRSWQRLGEVDYFLDHFEDAASEFDRARQVFSAEAIEAPVEQFEFWETAPVQEAAWAQLEEGAAWERRGEPSKAGDLYAEARDAVLASSEGLRTHYIALHAASQVGLLALSNQEWETAALAFEQAIEIGSRHEETLSGGTEATAGEVAIEDRGQAGMLHGAQENNLALAYVKLKRPADAVDMALGALGRDPASPIFLDTAAFALQAANRTSEAMDYYRGALGRDATSYASANNLAVVLAESGQCEQARTVLLDALAAKPNYGIAWHNLGVLDQDSWSLGGFLRSQGELGRGAMLDPALREAGADLIPDLAIYDTGFDVSRPVPPDWSYAASAKPPTTHWTWTLIVLLAIRILFALASEFVGGRISERILSTESGRIPWWRRQITATLAALFAAVLLVGRGAILSPTAANLVLLTTAAGLVGAPLVLRWWYDRSARQYSTPPVLAAGALGGVLGLPFAPFPGIQAAPHGRLRTMSVWIAPLLIGATASISFVLTIVTGVPHARLTTLAALTLLSSIFIAIPPMDGHQIRGRLANLSISIVLLAAVVAFAVPLV